MLNLTDMYALIYETDTFGIRKYQMVNDQEDGDTLVKEFEKLQNKELGWEIEKGSKNNDDEHFYKKVNKKLSFLCKESLRPIVQVIIQEIFLNNNEANLNSLARNMTKIGEELEDRLWYAGMDYIEKVYNKDFDSIMRNFDFATNRILATLIRYMKFIGLREFDETELTLYKMSKFRKYIRSHKGVINACTGDERVFINSQLKYIDIYLNSTDLLYDEDLYITNTSLNNAIEVISDFAVKSFVKISLYKKAYTEEKFKPFAEILELPGLTPGSVLCKRPIHLFRTRVNDLPAEMPLYGINIIDT